MAGVRGSGQSESTLSMIHTGIGFVSTFSIMWGWLEWAERIDVVFRYLFSGRNFHPIFFRGSIRTFVLSFFRYFFPGFSTSFRRLFPMMGVTGMINTVFTLDLFFSFSMGVFVYHAFTKGEVFIDVQYGIV